MYVFDKEFFENARRKLKLTNKEIAKLIGVTPGTLCTWKSGQNVPSSDSLAKLAKLLEVSSGDLMRVVDKDSPDIAPGIKYVNRRQFDTLLMHAAACALDVRDELILENPGMTEDLRKELLADTELYFSKLWKAIELVGKDN